MIRDKFGELSYQLKKLGLTHSKYDFMYSEPQGNYELDLAVPGDRAVFMLLLQVGQTIKESTNSENIVKMDGLADSYLETLVSLNKDQVPCLDFDALEALSAEKKKVAFNFRFDFQKDAVMDELSFGYCPTKQHPGMAYNVLKHIQKLRSV